MGLFAAPLVALAAAWSHPGGPAQLAPLDQALLVRPDDASVLLRRCDVHRAFGHIDAALSDCARAAALDPGLRDLALSRGLLFADAGQPERALIALRGYLDSHPGHAGAWGALAESLARTGAWPEAAQAWERSLSLRDRTEPDHYLSWSAALVASGRADLGLEALDRGVERLGRVAALRQAAVRLELEEGAVDAALARLDTMIADARQPAALWAWRARILARDGRDAEPAWREARRALEAIPATRRQHGRVAALRDEVDRALAAAVAP